VAHFSVLGADGFVGSSLVRHLQDRGHSCDVVHRNDRVPQRCGHLIFCIGVSSDFRTRPFDTMEAHVSVLARILRGNCFESFTYLSSTRVYLGATLANPACEDMSLTVNPNDPNFLYNASKLAGESLCLAIDNPLIRVVRLSNVYGADDRSNNFLTVVLRNVITRGNATLFNAMSSEKDYISIVDVVQALELIPLQAISRLINLGSGRNVSNRELAALILRYTGCAVRVLPNAPELKLPQIVIDRLIRELNIRPRDIVDEFPTLIAATRKSLATDIRAGF
jgi:nucleoside-diphosphate-sugar epimerase